MLFTCLCFAQSSEDNSSILPESSPAPEDSSSTTPETSPTPEDSSTVQPESSVTPQSYSNTIPEASPITQPEASISPEQSTPDQSTPTEDTSQDDAETLSIDLLDQLSFKIRSNSKCGKTICHACRKGQSRRFFLNKQGCILCSCE